MEQVHIDTIKTADPFESLFPIDAKTLDAICANMQEHGYDQHFPVLLWNGVVIDGHTRVAGARSVGITHIPVDHMEFEDEDAAMEYAIHCQRDRRNLTDADITRFVMELDKRKREGRPEKKTASSDVVSGRSSEKTTALIGILSVMRITSWVFYRRVLRLRALVEEQNRRRMADLQPRCAMITGKN